MLQIVTKNTRRIQIVVLREAQNSFSFGFQYFKIFDALITSLLPNQISPDILQPLYFNLFNLYILLEMNQELNQDNDISKI